MDDLDLDLFCRQVQQESLMVVGNGEWNWNDCKNTTNFHGRICNPKKWRTACSIQDTTDMPATSF